MFETLLFTTLLSITAIIAGSVVLLALVFIMTRGKKTASTAIQPAPQLFERTASETEPELTLEPDLILEPEFIVEPESTDEVSDELPGSIIIANDYEREANPVHTSPEFIDDSFVDLFEEVPIVSSASLSWHDKQERRSRMANRLDRLAAPPSEPSRPSDHRTTRPNRPLPMPVAPAGVEPIPELEPTELIIDRPEWATEWPG